MSDAVLQGNTFLSNLTDTKIDDNPMATQALILGAYLEDKSKWENTKFALANQIDGVIKDIGNNVSQLRKYPRLKLKLYRIFGIKTKAEKNVKELNSKLSDLNNQLKTLLDNPPDPNTYELAMFGNLFKAR